MDEMGPGAAKRSPGQQAIDVTVRPAQRAKHEIDYGRRAKGSGYGALWAATGTCWTRGYPRRSQTHFIDCLCDGDQQVPAGGERIDAILDNLGRHHCHDLLLFLLHHPRGEFVYPPKYAAYLNLIEPWWKILRSLALKGRRFETWQEVVEAVEDATGYWNGHKHPFVWGRRRRHQAPRRTRKYAFTVKVLRI
jgi:transposase